MTKRRDEEKFLMKIPFLGYFFRKIKKNREAIEKALNEGGSDTEIRIKDYLGGVVRVISGKTFSMLKLKKK